MLSFWSPLWYSPQTTHFIYTKDLYCSSNILCLWTILRNTIASTPHSDSMTPSASDLALSMCLSGCWCYDKSAPSWNLRRQCEGNLCLWSICLQIEGTAFLSNLPLSHFLPPTIGTMARLMREWELSFSRESASRPNIFDWLTASWCLGWGWWPFFYNSDAFAL